MIGKFFKHYQEGNLSLAVKFKLNNWLDKQIEKEEQKQLTKRPLSRFYIRNEEEAYEFFFRQARLYFKAGNGNKKIILFGDQRVAAFEHLTQRLKSEGVSVETISENGFDSNSFKETASSIACFISCYFQEKINHRLCTSLLNHGTLKDVPFEYLGDTREDFSFARKQDHQHSLDFVSPILIEESDYFKIYEESLTRFEKKCDIRDYMDLCQLIKSIIDRNIPGDVAEFGSFKGHSGYLISRLLKAMRSDKTLYMFDTFEKFPTEEMGVDSFWSETHEVNYEEVKSKFADNNKVKLVKGDFTKTLADIKIDKLSFIYIDCDSYRASTFLMEELFDKVLSPGGLLVLEDYGHPALLGNRLAFHHFFDKRKSNFRYFSQFSGFQIVVK
ncbi:MAG: class I SAM-dependent methyltransferase [Bacteroidia bacterium]|nr:class I SAM-dependent methyltransferase [Bacteroidia bacterium]